MSITIYVDALIGVQWSRNWKWRRKSHLFVDTDTDLLELHDFAANLYLKPFWYQPQSVIPRYDLSSKHHTRAVANGAIPLLGVGLLGVFVRWKDKRG